MPLFKVTVRDKNQQPLPGVTIRLINSAGVDRLPGFSGKTPPVTTNGEGILSFSTLTIFGGAKLLPPGVYTVKAEKDGYLTASVETAGNFIGFGTFALTLEDATVDVDDYLIEKAETDSYSALRPININIRTPEGSPALFMRCEVVSQGVTSYIQIRPDENNVAAFDVRSRVGLRPEFLPVPDGEHIMLDPTFSGMVLLDFSVVTKTADTLLDEGLNIMAANFDPGLSDIESYRTKPYRWITPLKNRLIAFRGYYADVYIWPKVTQAEEAAMVLVRSDRNDEGYQIAVQAIDIPPMTLSSNRAVKVRVYSPESTEATFSELTLRIRATDEVVSEVLTVSYRS